MAWDNYNNSNTIGDKGSENGIIIADFGNSAGARITLEKGGDIAPFSITIGVYGLFFHTYFVGKEQLAKVYMEEKKVQISKILEHLKATEENRNIEWKAELEKQIQEIVA